MLRVSSISPSVGIAKPDLLSSGVERQIRSLFLEMGILPTCFCFSDSKHTGSSNKYSTQIEYLCHRFSLAQLRKSTNNFNDSQVIARVAGGTVYKGCICIEGVATEIALKRLVSNSEHDNHIIVDQFKNEIEQLCQLHHPNLVSLIGFCLEKSEKIVVYEYIPNGNLHGRLIGNTREPLPWKRRVEICIGAAHGLHYLHAGAKRIILHRDVKPHNILLDQNWIPKLSNFSLSLKGSLSMSKPKPFTDVQLAGTVGFVSNSLTEKCDVYSFGIVLLMVVLAKNFLSIYQKVEQLTSSDVDQSGSESESQHPQGSSYKNLAFYVYDLVNEGKGDELVDPFLIGKIAPECWKVFMDIAERCLLFEPNERPAMGEVEVELEHALALQEEADHANPSGNYSLLSTVTTPQPEHAN